jgi:ubiquinone/menaquinone biosynthesis C-methylase UbiE
MNWGYDGTDVLVSENEPERFQLQLYEKTVQNLSLKDQSIAEISCGRGGGLKYLFENKKPKSAVGIDPVAGNIKIARKNALSLNNTLLHYEIGDVQHLPLSDQTIDHLLCVEASHCYTNLKVFLAEARRVLAPNGNLLWTDFMPATDYQKIRRLIEPYFEIISENDITKNVLSAIKKDQGWKSKMIETHAAKFLQPMIKAHTAASPNSKYLKMLESRMYRYFAFQLRKKPISFF